MGAQAEPGRWNVFFYDVDQPWPDLPDPAARKSAARRSEWTDTHGAVSGQPFLLGPGGRPDRRINGFFESRQMRALDPDTWRKYAYALGTWLNFLLGRHTSWDHATPGDVEAFKYWRMADERNPARVAAGTFAGNLAALNTFYVWAARMHRVENPIVLREVSSRSGRPAVEELAAGPSGIRDRDVKWFDPAGYRRWRDVGLRGFNLDGQEDPSWRGRNEQRDAAFADGLYETGLRLQEWASVLDVELPPDDPQRGFATCWLADVCAKGRWGRRYWMPRGALTAVLAYSRDPVPKRHGGPVRRAATSRCLASRSSSRSTPTAGWT
jgi:integrase